MRKDCWFDTWYGLTLFLIFSPSNYITVHIILVHSSSDSGKLPRFRCLLYLVRALAVGSARHYSFVGL